MPLKKCLLFCSFSCKIYFEVVKSGTKWYSVVVIGMFMGEYNHTIDAKGRLIIPSKFREILGDNFVVTKGLDGCLFVYDNTEWTAFEEKLKALPLTNKESRKFVRFFLADVRHNLWEICAKGRAHHLNLAPNENIPFSVMLHK